MSGNWQSIAAPPSGFNAETMLLLTDGMQAAEGVHHGPFG
jgi:hypothetical protein